MAQVFNNSMVAHVWAQQTQATGRSSKGQFYFDGRVLFSYGRHYVAAYALPHPNGALIYLLNGDSYSETTSRHVSRARVAAHGTRHTVPGLTELSRVLESGLNAWTYPTDSNGRVVPTPQRASISHRREVLPAIKRHFESYWPGETVAARILDAMGQRNAASVAAALGRKITRAKAAKVKEEAAEAAKEARYIANQTPAEIEAVIRNILGRSHAPETRLKEQNVRLLYTMREAKARGWNKVAEAIKLRRALVRAALRDFTKHHAAAQLRNEKREAIVNLRTCIRAARETGLDANRAACAFENLACAFTKLNNAIGEIIPADTFAANITNAQLARQASAQKRREAEAAHHAAQVQYRAAWLVGSKERAPYATGQLSCPMGGALLRAVNVQRNGAGEVVAGTLETSHGAQVPLDHALRVFAFLKLVRARGVAWTRNGARLRVGHFQVDSVAPNGDFVAGCHRITWAEVARLSDVLGVAELAPSDTTESCHATA